MILVVAEFNSQIQRIAAFHINNPTTTSFDAFLPSFHNKQVASGIFRAHLLGCLQSCILVNNGGSIGFSCSEALQQMICVLEWNKVGCVVLDNFFRDWPSQWEEDGMEWSSISWCWCFWLLNHDFFLWLLEGNVALRCCMHGRAVMLSVCCCSFISTRLAMLLKQAKSVVRSVGDGWMDRRSSWKRVSLTFSRSFSHELKNREKVARDRTDPKKSEKPRIHTILK